MAGETAFKIPVQSLIVTATGTARIQKYSWDWATSLVRRCLGCGHCSHHSSCVVCRGCWCFSHEAFLTAGRCKSSQQLQGECPGSLPCALTHLLLPSVPAACPECLSVLCSKLRVEQLQSRQAVARAIGRQQRLPAAPAGVLCHPPSLCWHSRLCSCPANSVFPLLGQFCCSVFRLNSLKWAAPDAWLESEIWKCTFHRAWSLPAG